MTMPSPYVEKLEADIAALEERLNALQLENFYQSDLINSLEIENNELFDENVELHTEVDDLTEELNSLEAANISLYNMLWRAA